MVFDDFCGFSYLGSNSNKSIALDVIHGQRMVDGGVMTASARFWVGSNNDQINLSVFRSTLRQVRTSWRDLPRSEMMVWRCLNIKICWLMLAPIWYLKKSKVANAERCAAAPAVAHIGQPPRACHEARLPDKSIPAPLASGAKRFLTHHGQIIQQSMKNPWKIAQESIKHPSKLH